MKYFTTIHNLEYDSDKKHWETINYINKTRNTLLSDESKKEEYIRKLVNKIDEIYGKDREKPYLFMATNKYAMRIDIKNMFSIRIHRVFNEV